MGMSNFLGNISLALKLKLGYIPSTQRYESSLKQRWEDVFFYHHFNKEEVWNEYEQLKGQKFSSKSERKAGKNRIKEIEKSEKWKRYQRIAKSSKYARLLKLETTFHEDFEGNSLDQEKWLPKYYWGEMLMGKGYSHSEEYHHYTEGQNISLKGGVLTIKTCEESHQGVAWDKKFGFIPRRCDYTSGIINTGHSFRQQHGRFEAKVSFAKTEGVYNAFWMVGESATPHLNIFKVNNNLELGIIHDVGKKDQACVSSDLLKESSYVVGIEWTAKEIKWLINGTVVKRSTNNLPNIPLYLVFSSGIHKKPEGALNNDFRVEWVRCYK